MNCTRCLKPDALCVCSSIEPVETRTHVLILQHPQEPDKELGSAHLAHLGLPNSTLKIGLSWPNVSRALGRETQPQRWAVLYLGSGIKGETSGIQPSSTGQPSQQSGLTPGLHFVTKQGKIDPKPPRAQELEGLIVLDGTWSQAKALWWRNAWLLKAKRVILVPTRKSLYKELRREPRRECLSTIESIAESLTALGESPHAADALRKVFADLLEKKRALLKGPRQARNPS